MKHGSTLVTVTPCSVTSLLPTILALSAHGATPARAVRVGYAHGCRKQPGLAEASGGPLPSALGIEEGPCGRRGPDVSKSLINKMAI